MKLDEYTRFVCQCNMSYQIVRVRKGIGYYFDSSGVYCSEKLDELERKGLWKCWWSTTGYNDLYQPEFDGISSRIVRRAITSLEVGDTINKFFEFVENAKSNRIPLPEGLDRFVTRINAPTIEREVGNKNTNTFDFIYVDVCIIQTWESDKKEYIKANLKEIKRRALEKIEKSKRFQRYGIPINFLRVTSITLTHDDVLHFIFELKKI